MQKVVKLSSLWVLRIYQDAMSHSFSLRGCEKAEGNQEEEQNGNSIMRRRMERKEEEERGEGEGGGF